MTDDDTEQQHAYALPTEILLYLFTYLSGKELIRCRRVCLRWKEIIDGLIRRDTLWHKHCRIEYKDIFDVARSKSRPGLLWFNIYRSLSLWPKLNSAREIWDEFCSASSINEEIRSLRILENGIIGVQKKGGIFYYDIETLERSKQAPITGDYLNYVENEDTILLSSYYLHLFIVRKVIYNPNYETNITFDQVKAFLLAKREVFYVTMNNEIYICELEDRSFSNRFIARTEDSIMCLGYTTQLNVLTYDRNIYSITGQQLTYVCKLDETSNLLHQLHKYNFLENLDWRVYFNWMYILNHTIPDGPLRDIITVRAYGDVIFVGSHWGVLRIYQAPFSYGEFNLFTAEPIKQYNFMERSDCPVLCMCPIIQIDVMESEDGHTVLVVMPKKIAVLEFVHNFKRTASDAMSPNKDIEKVKVLKIDEHV